MRRSPVTIPAVAIKWLRAGHDSFRGVGVAANAVGLDDAFRFVCGADERGHLPRAKDVHIAHPQLGLDVVENDGILVRRVAIGAHRCLRMPAVVPVLVGAVHHVAVVAGCRVVPEIAETIGHIDEGPQRRCQSQSADDEVSVYARKSVHARPFRSLILVDDCFFVFAKAAIRS